MKYQIIVAILIFDCGAACAQNLLPNPGFEDENICTELIKPCAPSGWELVYVNDLYNYVPREDSHTGNHASAIATYKSNGRKPFQFIEAPILCPLINGKKYRFSMYTRYGGSYFGDIGIYFSQNHICIDRTDSSREFNDISFTPPNLMDRGKERKGDASKEWIKEEWEYTADGTERFIIIGNFQSGIGKKNRQNNDHDYNPDIKYVYIDDVSLTPEDSCCACNYSDYLEEIYTKYRRRHSCAEELPSDSFVKVYEKIDLKPGKPIVLKDINFNTASAELLTSSNDMLDSIVSFLKHNEKIKLEISGHTDNEGSDDYNMTLSENRANSVMTYLILHGIDSERLTAVGYGNTIPIASNATDTGKAVNRRVEIKILPE